MGKLVEELVHIEDLTTTIRDLDDTFKPQVPNWEYIWYRLEGNREEVLLVGYSNRQELLEREKDR